MVIAIVATVILLLLAAMYFGFGHLYTKGFGKHTVVERKNTYYYDHYKDLYPRREVMFQGKAALLHGFI